MTKICNQTIIYGNIFGSKAKKCIVCGLMVHKICFKVKGAPKKLCKKMISEDQKEIGKEGVAQHSVSRRHPQWVVRKANYEVKCLVCSNACNNLSQIVTHRCLWCNKFRHDFCKE